MLYEVVKESDAVILYKSITIRKVIHPGEENKQFNVNHSEIIGKKYNTKYKDVYILKPYPSLFIETLKKQTQILYEPDISLIIFMLNIKEGNRVLESGTGSGVLTNFLSKFVGTSGKVVTVERNLERFQNLKKSKLINQNTGLLNQDIACFIENTDDKTFDAIFLDIPNPESIVKECYRSLIDNRKLCVFVPTVEQVIKVRDKMNKYFFEVRMFENIKKDYFKRNKNLDGLIGSTNYYSHTGFLIFGCKK